MLNAQLRMNLAAAVAVEDGCATPRRNSSTCETLRPI